VYESKKEKEVKKAEKKHYYSIETTCPDGKVKRIEITAENYRDIEEVWIELSLEAQRYREVVDNE